MQRERSVSPVGASRFERPFSPPSQKKGVQRAASVKNNTARQDSKNTSPASPAHSTAMSHFSHPSTATAATASTMRTETTAASSVDSHNFRPTTPLQHQHKHQHLNSASTSSTPTDSPSCSLPFDDPDEWLARFRSDPDLSISLSDECPDRATLAAVYDLPIFAADGTSRPFGSLYDPAYALYTRQLVLFVRHFYCGACQAYLQALAESITKEDYFSIPIPTSIIIIGCGKPDLIPQYKKYTSCPFPIFADPSRQLFKKLGMVVTLNVGKHRPDYMSDISLTQWINGQMTTIRKSLKDPEGIRKRDIVRGGHPMQIGGEFLFEDGEVVWCHRMRNYRGHAEVPLLRKLLELDE